MTDDDDYLFDSAAARAGQRFVGLEATFDSSTRRHLLADWSGCGLAGVSPLA